MKTSQGKRARLISVMPYGPAYDYYKGKEPEHKWTRPDGGTVGFWAREWMDLLGAEVLKRTDRFSWEVWQPDGRADRVYEKELPTGVLHKLFPAEELRRPWPHKASWLSSPRLFSELGEGAGERRIYLLYGTYGFRNPFFYEALGRLKGVKAPVLLRSGGMFRAPLSELLELHRPLTYLQALDDHFRLRAAIARADAVSEQSSSALAELRKVYAGRTEKLTLGCDFSFWRAPTAEEKAGARAALGINGPRKVFFASGNFVPRKQLDRLAEAFLPLAGRDDFFLLIAGHGGRAETDRLAALTEPLARAGKALLHPYAEGGELRRLYWACDLYASVATDEGGPASVMKALACGLPVLSTPVGETADSLRACGAGRIVPVRDYRAWTAALEEILAGKLTAPMPPETARRNYDWDNVAARYIKVFGELEAAYFGGRDEG